MCEFVSYEEFDSGMNVVSNFEKFDGEAYVKDGDVFVYRIHNLYFSIE